MSTPIYVSHLSHYQILEIPENATEKEISRAYKMKALKNHPDKALKNHLTEEKAKDLFLETQQAFEVLSNPNTRAEYDRKLAMDRNINKKNPTAEFNLNSPKNQNISNKIDNMMKLLKVMDESAKIDFVREALATALDEVLSKLNLIPSDVKDFFDFSIKMFIFFSPKTQLAYIRELIIDPQNILCQTLVQFKLEVEKREMKKREEEEILRFLQAFTFDKNYYINKKIKNNFNVYL